MARKRTPAAGHNSEAADWSTTSGERLRSLIERIERLDEEKKALASDIKDIFAEAKSAGFDIKAMREIIRERKQDSASMEEHLALVDTYRRALGMAPLGL